MSSLQEVGYKKNFFSSMKVKFMNFLFKFVTRYPLANFIIRRILSMIPIMLIVSFMTLGLMELRPGDILTEMRMNPQMKPEYVDLLAKQYGLDKSFLPKYWQWLKGVILHGDLGASFEYKMPVLKLVKMNLKNTLILNILSIILVYALAIPLGVVCAVKQFQWQDRSISFISFIFLSTPTYFFAFMLMFLAYLTQRYHVLGPIVFPVGGLIPHNWDQLNSFQKFLTYMHHMILPVLATSLGGIASFVRFMRSQMLEELNKLYITTARAKGLRKNTIIYKHAFRNAINPFVSNFGFIFVNLISGSTLVEIVMGFPGIGYFLYQAVLKEDMYLVMGYFIITSSLTLLGIMFSDILLSILDPRIRIS